MTDLVQTAESRDLVPVRALGVITRPQSIRSALYFRVSSHRQTTENQFEDLIQIAEREGPHRDWPRIRELLAMVIDEESRPTKSGEICIVYRVNESVARRLAEECIYVEQGLSGRRSAKRRPLFQQVLLRPNSQYHSAHIALVRQE